MRRKAILVFVPLVLGLESIHAAELPEAAITLQVMEEGTRKPVADADARVSFTIPDGQGGTMEQRRAGLTDANGKFGASERTLFNVTFSAAKSGYYKTGMSYDFKPTLGARYEPWNPTMDVLLKRIINPVPMYARQARIEIPAVDKPVGFDLMASDWVSPYGKGLISDLVFRVDRQFNTRTDYRSSLSVTFSNDGDGLLEVFADGRRGSALRLPHNAPEEGYQGQWYKENSDRAPLKVRKDQNYFYRVRTVKENGKIKSALYGKIHGEIEFDVINSKTGIILFTYYLNPDGTRNVEFDPNKNLLSNLRSLEP